MEHKIKDIVIVGGGTAGWITAGLLAARHPDRSQAGIQITLIESPDVSTIGVGEGTWPTIRKTLASIGLKETDFLLHCEASFKQGSRFDGWVNGAADDAYHHPFELPISQHGGDLLQAWKTNAPDKSFAEAVCVQTASNLDSLAPKQRSMPDFVGAMNYAYHLDATKLAELLKTHIVNKLGVNYVQDHVTDIIGAKDGDIEAVTCREQGNVSGDIFVDCTGHAALLLGQHYGIEFIDQGHILPNDRAIVTQIPIDSGSPIVSETVSTAHAAGWIWDIGLPTRRGIGCVYDSDHMDDEAAEEILKNYIKSSNINTRLLKFRSGHRASFWHQNCVAIGQSAGFLEPLEASAIVLIELSAEMLVENLPATRSVMTLEARTFNEVLTYRWARIIDFLKLHYVLSRREEAYWVRHRDPETIPQRLQDYLKVWTCRPPSQHDFEQASEVFPVSSYLFVAYGMGMTPVPHSTLKPRDQDALQKKMQNVLRKQRAFAAGLPTNRAFLAGLAKDASKH